jgi:hypothetical protein
VIRFWDFDVRDDLDGCVAKVAQVVAERRRVDI